MARIGALCCGWGSGQGNSPPLALIRYAVARWAFELQTFVTGHGPDGDRPDRLLQESWAGGGVVQGLGGWLC